MLDELKEAEAYLSDPSVDLPRIQKNLLTGNSSKGLKLNGIADYLTIVCCRYLYGYSGMKDNHCDDNIRKAAKLIMRIWCGFEGDVSESELKQAKESNSAWFRDYPFAEGWLKKYYSIHLTKAPDWKDYSNEWKRKLNSDLVYANRQNCYEIILSAALAHGPLKTYYLMIKTDYVNIRFKPINANSKKITAPTSNKITKLLSVYMLQRRFHPNQKWVLAPKQRILNWMGYDNDNTVSWFPKVLWHGQELFKKESMNNYVKITVNQSFLEEMDLQLSETKPKNIPNGYTVYFDTGYGKDNPLKAL